MYNNYPVNPNEDRFLMAPFLLGGIAGTALGYGIANNNQDNYYPMYPYPMYQPVPVYYQQPTQTCPNCQSTNNNYYYY